MLPAPGGHSEWVVQFGSSRNDELRGLSVDASTGRLYAGGVTQGSVPQGRAPNVVREIVWEGTEMCARGRSWLSLSLPLSSLSHSFERERKRETAAAARREEEGFTLKKAAPD